ncbi:MAG: uroporphyrinogen decarboxylase family protein [Spirochaetota bacterium]
MTRRTIQPDFDQLLSVLANRRSSRRVLFEFAIGGHVLSLWTDRERPGPDDHAGTLRQMPDVIEMGYDAKHSFEDKIFPVEETYRTWGSSIAILGGIDVDFLARGSEPDIAARSRAMLDLADERGGYALGSGNSIPEYVPAQRFLAMRDVAIAARVTG